MKYIKLTQGKKAMVDDEDFIWLSSFRWHLLKCKFGDYAKRTTGGKYFLMHREILKAPKNKEVDHIDRDRLNNQKSNLRLVTRKQNAKNRRPNRNNPFGVKGVQRLKDPRYNNLFSCQIKSGKKVIRRFGFITLVEAMRCYDELARKYHGEYASTNF